MLVNSNKLDPEIHLLNDSFDPEISGKYRLFIDCGFDGLSLAVAEIASNKFIALQVYSFFNLKSLAELCVKLSQIFDDDLLAGNVGYHKVDFCFNGQKSTLVPDPLFNPLQATQYISFNFQVQDDELIFTDHLKMLGAKNVFTLPEKLVNLITAKFPQVSIHHTATAFIESLLKNNKNRDEKIVTVNIHLTGFEMAVTKRNELIFYNSFSYQSSEDFIYFVLFTLEQLQLNPETVPFVFTGSAERSSALYLTAQKYIRYVGFAERTENYSFAEGFETFPPHFYYNLFNQHLCE